MKAFAVVVALLIVAALTVLLWPRLVPASTPGPFPKLGEGAGSGGATGVVDAPRPTHPLHAPLSREEQVREEFAEKRVSFYRFLRQNYADVVEKFAVIEALDTLDLVVSRDDDETLNRLVEEAVSPSAKDYGFRKIRFYVRNPADSVEPFLLVAESTWDGSGRWNTFRK